jgi:oleate hydratase
MNEWRTSDDRTRQAWIVGAGIAGLAAAALLIREGGWAGRQIHLLEQAPLPGGSLDGAGDAERGYRIRGGRMLEAHYDCTFDLFRGIPTLTDPTRSVAAEIRDFTQRVVPSSNCRLVVNRQRIEAPPLELGPRDRLELLRLLVKGEAGLDRSTVEENFSAGFFETNFWYLWSTMFAFQRWHSAAEFRRYLRRFIHLMPGFNRLEGIWRTPLNQYDSLIRPLVAWLRGQGVELRTGARVDEVGFGPGDPPAHVTGLHVHDSAGAHWLGVGEHDRVILTLGSMTGDAAFGSLSEPAPLVCAPDGGAWALWRNIATRSAAFGRPERFCGDVQRSVWYSFTVTLRDPAYFTFMARFTGNSAGTGGLVTFRNSHWLLSVVLPHQPHFAEQPDDVTVFWGYALYSDRPGDRVAKPIAECSGAEILEELAWHLPLDHAARRALMSGNCLPCAMPWITSQFMPRTTGDRPEVLPAGARNYALIGQFCEVPEDTVFTVEYSVRSAQQAVGRLLGRDRPITPVYPGYRDPGVILRALRALH